MTKCCFVRLDLRYLNDIIVAVLILLAESNLPKTEAVNVSKWTTLQLAVMGKNIIGPCHYLIGKQKSRMPDGVFAGMQIDLRIVTQP